MNIIRISTGEAIIEPFFDGGESYPDHKKYSCLSQYRVQVAPQAQAAVTQEWASVQVLIYHGPEAETAVCLERSCDLDISQFDSFLLSGSTDNVCLSLTLRTELGEEKVLDKKTVDDREVSGHFRGKRLLGIRLEAGLLDKNKSGGLVLRWFGLADSRKPAPVDSHFSPDWEGCFAQDYEIAPQDGIWVSRQELPAFREKLKKPPFDRIYRKLREEAESYMDLKPEEMIRDHLLNENPFFTRKGQTMRSMVEYLPALSFVGMVEENREMIRLAGRLLLSIAVTPRWCESFMGACPGVTWHHRSFLEGIVVKRCALALDWIGSSLTWHGKNIVYDAIIQKGLPRLEADLFSVEYVRNTNQGVVFNNERIFGYICLAKRYPRYAKMLQIAQEDFFEMVQSCLEADGGYREGPGYWNYNMDNMVEAANVLARYHGKPIGDFAPERLQKSGDYGLCMLSSRPEGLRYLRINDSYSYGIYSAAVADFYYRLTGNPLWNAIKQDRMQTGVGLEMLVQVASCPSQVQLQPALMQGLLSLPESGETALCRREGDTEVLWHVSAGAPYFCHYHEDKGQILLCVNAEELLCDRGNSSAISKKTVSHNLFVPESQGLPYCQSADAPGGKVLLAEYENGCFRYEADLTGAWKQGIFEKITRQLYSEDLREMLVTDSAVCLQQQPMSLRFHSVYPICHVDGKFKIQGEKTALWIVPVDYQPERYEIREDGVSVSGETVYQLVLHLPTAKQYSIRTKLEILS